MEAIIFCGIQATGKSTFYRQHFFDTHLRISMDQLHTRNKEGKLLDYCFSRNEQLFAGRRGEFVLLQGHRKFKTALRKRSLTAHLS